MASRLRTVLTEAGLAARTPQPIEDSIGLTAWRPGQDWQATYEVVDSELFEEKRRQKEARRLLAYEKPATPIRILGRTSGRRRVASG